MRQFKRLLNSLHKREEGVTGLETAIILIAFVIVASVFAFVVLSTGLFSAERGRDTVFAGLERARGNLEVRGAVTVTDSNTSGTITSADVIEFNLAPAAAGQPVLVDPSASNNSVIVNYIDAQAKVADATYTVSKLLGDGDDLLETGELFEINVAPPGSSTLVANEVFTIEVVPPAGGALVVTRTMPPAIDTVMDLH